MAGFLAAQGAAVLAAALSGVYLKLLRPHYHLKYSQADFSQIKRRDYGATWLFAMAALLPLCLKAAAEPESAMHIFFASLLIVIAAVDFNYKKIPNSLVLAALGIGVLFALIKTILYDDYMEILRALGGGIVATAFVVAAVLLVSGSFGAGDVKLLFAVGVYLGAGLSPFFLMLTFLLAAAFSLALIAAKKAGRKSRISLAPFMAYAFVITVYFEAYFMAFTYVWRMR